jgi:hypothetical protein
MDNIAVKGLKIDYNRELLSYKIWRFIIEYIINLDYILTNIELAGVTASIKKLD